MLLRCSVDEPDVSFLLNDLELVEGYGYVLLTDPESAEVALLSFLDRT